MVKSKIGSSVRADTLSRKHSKEANQNRIVALKPSSILGSRSYQSSKPKLFIKHQYTTASSRSDIDHVVLHHIAQKISQMHNIAPSASHLHHTANISLADRFDHLDTLLNLSLIHKTHAVQVARYLFHIGKMTANTGLKMVSTHLTRLANANAPTDSKSSDHAVSVGRRVMNIGRQILLRSLNLLKAAARADHHQQTKVHKSKTKKSKFLPQ